MNICTSSFFLSSGLPATERRSDINTPFFHPRGDCLSVKPKLVAAYRFGGQEPLGGRAVYTQLLPNNHKGKYYHK